MLVSFPDSSVDKESTCNAGDPGLIPGSGRSAGKGIGYPLQYSWTSLVAQLVKNPLAMQETWVQSLGWEDPLEKGKATHSSILAWRIPQTLKSMGSQKVGRSWANFTFTSGKFDAASSNWISFPINSAVENHSPVANFESQLLNDHLHEHSLSPATVQP